MTRNAHAGIPFSDDDAAIAAALEDVSVPALLCSLVHITGDTAILDGPLRPQGCMLNEVQGYMSPEDQAAARAMALPLIAAYRDAGCPEPPAPSDHTIHRMMEFLACGEVPTKYVPMMVEEMELLAHDPRRVHWPDRISAAQRAEFPVVVIGAGESGLLAGIRLAEAGVPFTIFERNAGVGGTWWANSYPGARVDVGNHFYCYSFEPVDHWSEFYAQQPELQRYFEGVMDARGIRPHVQFGTEVVRAEWHDPTATWQVTVRAGDGAERTVTARAVISAVGQLSSPKLPSIDGMARFAGPAFHSARWDHSVSLDGKRVAVVGAGASAFQIVPTIVDTVAHLSVFQRTPPWMFPNPGYHAKVGPGVQWAVRHLPFYARWYRFLIFWPGCDGALATARIDPDWPRDDTISELNLATRNWFLGWMHEQCGDDEELKRKITPDYPPTGRRTLQDNGSWLGALRRDHVDLITDEIDHIDERGVVDATGERHDVDVIVYATGFRPNDFLHGVDVVGRDGTLLAQHFGDEPRAYLGITTERFPNLFFMYGPSTNLAHGGSLIFHSECQIRYIMGCLALLVGGEGGTAMEPRPEVEHDYVERTQAEIATLVWSHPKVRSYFKNRNGKIFQVSPWPLVDYWAWTKAPDPADFTFHGPPER